MYLIGDEEVEAVRRVIESGQLFRYRGGEGGETDQFEREWCEELGARHAIAMTSGTGALICGLVGMGVGPGDEVIVPAYTFMSSALAPLAVGAVPILAEIDESLTIDPADLERKITPRTKAVMPVHMLGLPSNMSAVMAVARRRSLKVLEDACQAAGGSYDARRLGTLGDAGAFSFNHFKIITCGEGGALVTDDERIYQAALVHHDGGCVFRDHASEINTPFFAGWNFRINEILSAILRVQLTRLDGILDALRAEKRLMMDELSGLTALSFSPVHDAEGECATSLALLFESSDEAGAFKERLKEQDVDAACPLDSGRHVYTNWEPVMQRRGAHHPERDAFRLAKAPITYSPDMCPRTLDILGRTICLATSPTRSRDELRTLINAVRKAC